MGLVGSGKTLASHYMADEFIRSGYNSKYIKISTLVKEEFIDVFGRPSKSREELQQLHIGRNSDWLINRFKSKLFPANDIIYIIDGVRNRDLFNYLRNKQKFYALSIVTPYTTRTRRISGRDKKTKNQIYNEDKRDFKFGTAENIVNADYFILNNGSRDILRNNIIKFTQSFIKYIEIYYKWETPCLNKNQEVMKE